MSSTRGLPVPLAVLPGRSATRCPARCHARAVDPLGLEAEPVELGPNDPAHLADAVEIVRAAVDVDEPLEQ